MTKSKSRWFLLLAGVILLCALLLFRFDLTSGGDDPTATSTNTLTPTPTFTTTLTETPQQQPLSGLIPMVTVFPIGLTNALVAENMARWTKMAARLVAEEEAIFRYLQHPVDGHLVHEM